jgi:hypothetical protein
MSPDELEAMQDRDATWERARDADLLIAGGMALTDRRTLLVEVERLQSLLRSTHRAYKAGVKDEADRIRREVEALAVWHDDYSMEHGATLDDGLLVRRVILSIIAGGTDE